MSDFEGGCFWDNERRVFVPYNEMMADEFSKHFEHGKPVICLFPEMKAEKQRTALQNRSLWLYLSKLATTLNDAGYDLRQVSEAFKAGFQISCTKDNLMEVMWRPIQGALFSKTSTTSLSTKEVSETYEHVNQFVGRNFDGVHVPWPDRFGQSLENIDER